jgi:hypothetical protein
MLQHHLGNTNHGGGECQYVMTNSYWSWSTQEQKEQGTKQLNSTVCLVTFSLPLELRFHLLACQLW